MGDGWMKKLAYILVALFLLAVPVMAASWVQHSTEKTADALIDTGKGTFHGILVTTDGTNAVTVEIYDGLVAAGGTQLIATWEITTSSTNRGASLSMDPPVKYDTGLFIDITCSGTVQYMVYYEGN